MDELSLNRRENSSKQGGVEGSVGTALETADFGCLFRDFTGRDPALAGGQSSVKPLPEPGRVFHLVLELRGTFIANGYLVRSKPLAD